MLWQRSWQRNNKSGIRNFLSSKHIQVSTNSQENIFLSTCLKIKLLGLSFINELERSIEITLVNRKIDKVSIEFVYGEKTFNSLKALNIFELDLERKLSWGKRKLFQSFERWRRVSLISVNESLMENIWKWKGIEDITRSDNNVMSSITFISLQMFFRVLILHS